MKILPGREEVTLDRPDNGCLSPLLYAAESTHNILHSGVLEEVVKILPEREEVSPDKPDNGGRTLLSHAVGEGNEAMVRILLGREEVSPNRRDKDGKTPLIWVLATKAGSNDGGLGFGGPLWSNY